MKFVQFSVIKSLDLNPDSASPNSLDQDNDTNENGSETIVAETEDHKDDNNTIHPTRGSRHNNYPSIWYLIDHLEIIGGCSSCLQY
jgi:hypothetical protein